MRASAQKFAQKVIGEGGLRATSTLFVLALARTVGAQGFGLYSTALAYAALCGIFVDLGTNSILTREIARHPEKRILVAKTSHLLKIIAAFAAWMMLILIARLFNLASEQRYMTLALGIVVIGQALTDYFCALLNGIEEMGWEAALKVVSRILGLSLGFISLALHQSLHAVVTSMAFGTIAGYGISVWIVRRRFKSFGIGLNRPFLKYLIFSSMPLFGSVIFWNLYDAQDVLLLSHFHFSLSEIGFFSAAMKILEVARVYPVLMLGVFFPMLAKLHLADPLKFRTKSRRLLAFMTGSLILFAALIYATAPWLIPLLYHADFTPAVQILRLLLPALVAIGINHAQVQMLIALNRERKLLAGALLVCGSNLLLAWLLLPRYGIPGTCYALLGSEMIYFFFLRYAMRSDA